MNKYQEDKTEHDVAEVEAQNGDPNHNHNHNGGGQPNEKLMDQDSYVFAVKEATKDMWCRETTCWCSLGEE